MQNPSATDREELGPRASRRVRRAAYRVGKYLGLFALCRRLTRRGLRILCYHGISSTDGHIWLPMMFMRPETFAARMQALLDLDYPVLGLDEAVRRLAAGDFPDCATVVTIDDGFYLAYDKALPILADRGLPATLYVTTYYAEKQTPIFYLVVEYMFWRSTRTDFALAELQIPSLIEEDETSAQAQILEYGMQLDEPGRVDLCRTLGRCLGVAYEGIEASRQLHLLGGDEVRRAAEMGTDIQLHTRRHRFPRNEAEALRELRENVRDLRPYTTTALVHFCYPRGWYHESQIPWLELEGMKSATTTDPGFNYAGANPFTLKRFLDSDEFSQIEFEAELSGFTEVLRRGRARIKTLLGRRTHWLPSGGTRPSGW